MDKTLLRKQFTVNKESTDDENTAVAVISTDIVDRDKEVLLPKGAKFDNFLKNPIVMWVHDYHGTPVGSVKKYWIKRGRKYIKAKWEWAPTEKAQEIRQLWEGDFLNAVSVGFLPAEDGSHPPKPEEIKNHPEWAEARRIYDDWELLEFSIVPVPANPEALAAAVKSKEISISKELQNALGIEDEEEFYTTATGGDGKDDFVYTKVDVSEKGENVVLKPYPNEHSCRLKPPNYPKYRRQKCAQKHDGKCIDVIYGIRSPNKSEIQALRFDKEIWTAGAAKSVCSDRGGTFEAAKPEKIEVEVISHSVEPVKIKVEPYIDVVAVAEEEIRRKKGIMYI